RLLILGWTKRPLGTSTTGGTSSSRTLPPGNKAKKTQSGFSLTSCFLGPPYMALQFPCPESNGLLHEGELERHACATTHTNVTSLKASIKRQPANSQPRTLPLYAKHLGAVLRSSLLLRADI
ncbi:Hypothetical protein FKW44_010599, partial [Caligus rogercresseyi]